ncbi:hypothetical protein [Kribbella deserti]|uniref:Uncharacterized protein n=1 Tax=Kribbella deserti TaxID=1926257 RepID=A0ABV6QHK7_9ACTN
MTRKVTEAELAIASAETFGRKPPEWAVEARKRELGESGGMPAAEALDVKIAATFGRVPDRERLAEAESVLASAKSSGDGTAALQGRMASVMNEITSLSESRLGLSHERAQLHAQSEALRCRESAGSVADAVRSLETYRDVLAKRPAAHGPRPSNEAGRQRPATSVDHERVQG